MTARAIGTWGSGLARDGGYRAPTATLRVRERAVAYGAPDGGPRPIPASDDTDALVCLGDRIAELARSIQVAEHEMMRLIVEFDHRKGWAAQGFGSCAEWLAWRIGIRGNAARERVRTAHALTGLPLTSAAMKAGLLSYSKVRSLTRVATPESEDALLEFARAGSAAHLERVVQAWKATDDRRELSLERLRHRNRSFSVWVDEDGGWRIAGRLDPEVGAVLMRAVEAAGDALYRTERDATDPSAATPPQRRADALGLVAERALAAGFGTEDSDARGGPARAERYQVHLLVEPDTLRVDRPSGRSELDGSRIAAETSRRLSCDAAVVKVTVAPAPRVPGEDGPERSEPRAGHPPEASHPPEAGHPQEAAPGVSAVTRGDQRNGSVPKASGLTGSTVLGVGRRTRTIPPALRRALQVRDGGCRFPGCGSRFTEGHHIVHWADGGRTDLKNLVLLCRRHHRAVHEGAMRICMDREAKVAFFARSGRVVFDVPARRQAELGHSAADLGGPAPAGPRPVTALKPAPPDPSSAWPGADRYRRDRDVPWAIEVRAREALDPA